MKYIPNLISFIRIVLSLCLLFFSPFDTAFLCLYIICGCSDMADGFLARKYNVASKAGEVLDSIGDMVFAGVLVIVVLHSQELPAWCWMYINGIAAVKVLSILIGYVKFKAFAGLHTYANKAAGLLIFVGIPMYFVFQVKEVLILLLIVGTLAAAEELFIIIKVKELRRNVRSIFKG